MRRVLMIGAALAAVCFLSGSVQAVEYKWTGDGFVEVGSATEPAITPTVKQSIVIPRGYHAHTREDGTVIVHGDENVGKAGPHAGVARPWPKTGYPGQVVEVEGSSILGRTVMTADCPNGVCPARRTGATAPVQSVSYAAASHSSHTEAYSGGGRKGVFARIADNARERRANRQSRRSGGGCR